MFVIFVFFCLYGYNFSSENKASSIKFCTVVNRRPGQEMSHFGELCSPRCLKSNESATYPEVKFRVKIASVITCL